MSQHTPAPWLYDIGETEALIVEQDGTTIAEIRTTYHTTAHRSLKANTRLMTAAPDLLDALYVALPFVEDCEADPVYKAGAVAKALKQIRAAIDKAEETTP